MAAIQINGITTTNIRVDILVDDNPRFGAKSGAEVASILRQLADKFEQGKTPMSHNEDSVRGATVDYH